MQTVKLLHQLDVRKRQQISVYLLDRWKSAAFFNIRCEMTSTSVGGEQQISISGGINPPSHSKNTKSFEVLLKNKVDCKLRNEYIDEVRQSVYNKKEIQQM
nr:hypothetical protein [uncultured Anaerobutyricum sp.]